MLGLRTFCLLGALVGGGLAGAGPLAAQTVTPEHGRDARAPDRDDIVVTGRNESYLADRAISTRDGGTLFDTPQSVQVLTEQLLRDQRADTFSALANLPSVRNSAPVNFDGVRVQVRGFFAPTALDGLLSKVGNGPAANLGPDLTGIDRIELLLGPASLLFGNSSPGGTINFISRQPEARPGYFLTTTIGAFDLYRVEADLTGPIDPQSQLAYRLSASFRDQGSFLEGANTRNSVITPAASVNLGDRTRLTVEGSYRLLELDRQNFGLPARGTILPNPNGRIPRERNVNTGGVDVEQYRIGFRFAHEIDPDWSIRSSFRFVTTAYDVREAELPGALEADGRTLPRFPFDAFDRYAEYQMQTTVHGKFATGAIQHNVTAGLDLSHSTADFLFLDFAASAPIDVFTPSLGAPRGPAGGQFDAGNKLRELGIFVQDRIGLGQRLDLVLGGRYDIFDQVDRDRVAATRTAQSGSAFSPRIGLLYRARDLLSFYANYSKSFQPQIGRSVTGAPFRPTRGEQVELGAKLGLTKQLMGNFAIYQITQTNVATPDPDNIGFSVLDGAQRSRGIEVSMTGEVTPGWHVQASYAYLDARVTRSTESAVRGQQVLRTSPHSASLWSNYEVQTGPLKGLGFGGGVYVVDRRPVTSANTLFVPGYTSIDAVLSYRVRHWRLAINAKNLTDSFAFDAFGASRVTYGTPRTIEATLSVDF